MNPYVEGNGLLISFSTPHLHRHNTVTLHLDLSAIRPERPYTLLIVVAAGTLPRDARVAQRAAAQEGTARLVAASDVVGIVWALALDVGAAHPPAVTCGDAHACCQLCGEIATGQCPWGGYRDRCIRRWPRLRGR